MTLLVSGRNAASEAPRYLTAPPRVSSAAPEVIELAAEAGLILDPSQQRDLEVMLGERADGKWAAFEVADVEPRQNGKNAKLEARQLGGLFLFGEQLQTHTAHRVDTCLEHFRRVKDRIEGSPVLSKRVKKITNTNGAEAIELTSGERLLFKARSKEAGRGFSGSTIYLDEALYLSQQTVGGMVPTMSAKSITGSPQLWYTSSAPTDRPESQVLCRLMRRGRKGGGRLVYIEYSADLSAAPAVVDAEGKRRLRPVVFARDEWLALAQNPERWAEANSALGVRIAEEFVQDELDAMELEEFLRERLGVWFDPEDEAEPEHVLGREAWKVCADPTSSPGEPIRLALDVSLDRGRAAFGVAGPCEAGTHVEVVDYAAGIDWVVPRAVDLQARWGGPLFVAAKSPASALIPDLTAAGVTVREVTVAEHALACAHIVDETAGKRMRHLADPVVLKAIQAAEKSWHSESFLWSRRHSSADICPLVAVTLAAWATTLDLVPARVGFVDMDDLLADD